MELSAGLRKLCGKPTLAVLVPNTTVQTVRAISTAEVTASGHLADASTPLEFGGNTAHIAPRTNMAATLTRTGVNFVRENQVIATTDLPVAGILPGTNLLDTLGAPASLPYLTGNKVQPVVFTDDLARVYVGGKGAVYEFDMLTFKLIDTINIPAGQNITSLATVGNLLFVGEGRSFGSGANNARLLAIDINPGSSTYNKVVSLKNTGVEQSPYGVSGMTAGPDGRTLVVAVPQNPSGLMMGAASQRGSLLIIDLNTLDTQ